MIHRPYLIVVSVVCFGYQLYFHKVNVAERLHTSLIINVDKGSNVLIHNKYQQLHQLWTATIKLTLFIRNEFQIFMSKIR